MVDSVGEALSRGAGTVVVGAGPAGAVLAARLAEAGEDVLLLEAGPDYGPPASGNWPERLLDPTLMPVEEVSWEYTSACQRGTPEMPLQRARVMGGCSSHNGCAAVWGHHSDYDAWAVANPGWSAAEVEPLFQEVNARLRVHTPPREELTPFHRAVLDAATDAGYPFVRDLSSLAPEFGFAIGPVNIDPATKIRWNAAFAYLDPIRHLPNLRIVPDTLAHKLTLDGTRVTGLDVVGPAGLAHIAADRVILTGGAYGSPLGRAFQFRDDLLGVFGDPQVTGKPAGDDLREGKRTVLVAHAYAHAGDAGQKLLLQRLGDPALDDGGIGELQQVIVESGARDAVESLISEYYERALKALHDTEITEEGRAGLTALADAAVRREF